MMRLARRTPLLVAFWLLTSAATAFAECAWVLWGFPTGKVYDYVDPTPGQKLKDKLVQKK